MSPAIQVEGISKQFRIGVTPGVGNYRTLRETVTDCVHHFADRLRGRLPGSSSAQGEFWALRDVSFAIQPGEVVGLIGRNGSGKSTLLKLLSRIYEPSEGRAIVRGRLGSLLEVGTGFHNELTGRENIYLNGAILGMSRREIDRKFDEIVAFAEMERFLDTPVKRYSSGMYVRLAFAVAAHLDLEVLLVDEVLAVGDQTFQKKCMGRMSEVAKSGRTVVLVSHNMATILNLCDKAVYLNGGRVGYIGDCKTAVAHYSDQGQSSDAEVDLASHRNRRSGMVPHLMRARVLTGDGTPSNVIGCGEPMMIEIDVRLEQPGEYNLQVTLDDHMGNHMFNMGTQYSDYGPVSLVGSHRLRCRIDQVPVLPGRYFITFYLNPLMKPWADVVEQALSVEISERDFFGTGQLPHPNTGRFLMRSNWALIDDEISSALSS